MAYADDLVLLATSPKALRRMIRNLDEEARKELGLAISMESSKSCWSVNFHIDDRHQPETFMTLTDGTEAMQYYKTAEGLPLLGSRWCLDGKTAAATEQRTTKSVSVAPLPTTGSC